MGIIFSMGSMKIETPRKSQKGERRLKENGYFIPIPVMCLCRHCRHWPLTNQDGHEEATDPLLDHFLDLWFRALGHDGEGVGVGDGPHGGGAQPGHPENGRDASHADQQEQVKVETRSFHHLPLGFAHNQADGFARYDRKKC